MPSACAPWSGRCHSSTPADASSAFRHRGSTGPAAGRRETAAASVAMFSYCSDIARKRPIPLHQPAGGRRYPASPRQRCAVKNATAHVPLSGLQVFKDGMWHIVEPVEGAFVINIGDMVQVWSNDEYRAAIAPGRRHGQGRAVLDPIFLQPFLRCESRAAGIRIGYQTIQCHRLGRVPAPACGRRLRRCRQRGSNRRLCGRLNATE